MSRLLKRVFSTYSGNTLSNLLTKRLLNKNYKLTNITYGDNTYKSPLRTKDVKELLAKDTTQIKIYQDGFHITDPPSQLNESGHTKVSCNFIDVTKIKEEKVEDPFTSDERSAKNRIY